MRLVQVVTKSQFLTTILSHWTKISRFILLSRLLMNDDISEAYAQLIWLQVWGGCSSHNAMVYVRGHALDYDRWESEGAEGWSYADCLPYFRKSQTHVMGENAYRGGNGPQFVSRCVRLR